MSTFWEGLTTAEGKVGEWLAEVGTAASTITAKIESIFIKEKEIAPEIVQGIKTLFADMEGLIPLLQAATTDEGINITADSAAFQQLMMILNDIKALAPQIETALKDVEND